MTELPEVEAFAYYLEKHALDKVIQNILIKDSAVIKKITPEKFIEILTSQKFTHVTRKGKYLVLDLSNSTKKLIMHFGLTGTLDYEKSSTKPDKFTKVIFEFNNGYSLEWIDKRKFGKLWLVDSISTIAGLTKLGPDPLHLTKKKFIEILLDHKNMNIKAFLMNQNIISGIGNEYSDEILYQAGIDPHYKIDAIPANKYSLIFRKTIEVLIYATQLRKKGIEDLHGQPFFSVADTQHFKSSYLQAHRKSDRLCPNNKNHKLKTAKIAGRTSYYCPEDQT